MNKLFCNLCGQSHELAEVCPQHLLACEQLLNFCELKPKGDRLIVLPDPEAGAYGTKETKIFIPENAQTKPNMGTVLAIGPEVNTKHYQPRMRIIYGMYAGIVWTTSEKITLRIMRAEEIMAEICAKPQMKIETMTLVS